MKISLSQRDLSMAVAIAMVPLFPVMGSASVVSITDQFSASTTTDMGTAPVLRRSFGPDWFTADFTAGGFSSEMEIFATASVTASYENDLSLSDSRTARILLESPLLSSGHRSSFFVGGRVDASLLNIINESESYSADLSTVSLPFPRRSDFGDVVTAVSASEQIGGYPHGVPGASVSLGINAFIETSHRLTGFSGALRAEHLQTGTIRQSFVNGLYDDRWINLALGLEGEWDLSFRNGRIEGDSTLQPFFGFGVSAEYNIGIGCGDPGTDADNGRLCIDDGSYTLPPVAPAPHARFSSAVFLNQSGSIDLGTINVTAAPDLAPVPLPGSGALLFTVLGAGFLLRRRKQTG